MSLPWPYGTADRPPPYETKEPDPLRTPATRYVVLQVLLLPPALVYFLVHLFGPRVFFWAGA